MRLLVLTQALDRRHPALGFFHGWVEALAKECESVIVVCLYKGEYTLPKNVTVLSLGKEEGKGRLTFLYRFFRYIIVRRGEYDSVFVHMNQIYVILGGLLWRLFGKRIGLWYAHGTTSVSLWIAEKLTHIVLTSTPEGFRLSHNKVRVVGQGIDTDLFPQCDDTYDASRIRIVCVGRVAPIKRNEVVIDAVTYLRAEHIDASATFVGDTSDEAYYASLRARVAQKDLREAVSFVGAVSPKDVSRYVCEADIFANPSATGSLDKVGLEALVSGVPVITSNPAFREMLGMYAERLMFPEGDAQALADRISVLHRAPDRKTLIHTLAESVKTEHSVEALIPRILSAITT